MAVTITKTSDETYIKEETIMYYQPTKEELYYWYGGTHGSLDPDNPYARKNSYSRRTRYILQSNEVEKWLL